MLVYGFYINMAFGVILNPKSKSLGRLGAVIKLSKFDSFCLILPHSGSQKGQNWDEAEWGV